MSKYTTLFRFPIEQELDNLEVAHYEENWPRTYRFAGLDDYPIFDEDHRPVLNGKIYRRFWFREIGFETWAQFRYYLRSKMHEIMPYYNQLYESELLEIENPLWTKDMKYDEVWTRDEGITSDTNSVGTVDVATKDRNVYQDTPMNGLDTGAIENMDYATNVTFDDATTDQDTTSSTHSDRVGDYDGTHTHREYGYDRPQSELLQTYRDTFLNIDLMVLRDLEPLFLGLW